MNSYEEKIILVNINLLNQLNTIKNNTNDENTYCEIIETINLHIKNFIKIGIKIIYLNGTYSVVDYTHTLNSNL
jgi:hypothetical protein